MRFGIGWVLAVGVAAGCSAHDTAGERTVSTPSSGGTLTELLRATQYECPKLDEGGSAASDRRQVFTELILMEAPTATARAARVSDLPQLGRDASVQLLAAPHLMGDVDQRAEQTLVDHIGVSQEASLHRLSLLPREASDGALVLELGVTLQLPNANGAVPAPTATTTVTMTGAEQRLLLASAPLPHRQDRALLALVKYWRIDGSQDLRGIFECKMRQRQSALSGK
jgi:hypothetical protein